MNTSGGIGRQASAALTFTCGDNYLYTTACCARTPKPGCDFIPLSVEHQARFSSVGQTSGGYNKRDGRPSENEVSESWFERGEGRGRNERSAKSVVASTLSLAERCESWLETRGSYQSALLFSRSSFPRGALLALARNARLKPNLAVLVTALLSHNIALLFSQRSALSTALNMAQSQIALGTQFVPARCWSSFLGLLSSLAPFAHTDF